MFRPLRLLGRNASKITIPSRSKIVFPESFLDKAERMKIWNQENKIVLGSIVESNRAKDKRSHREKRKRVAKELKINKHSIAEYTTTGNVMNTTRRKITDIAADIDTKGFVKNNEVICVEKEILPENKPKIMEPYVAPKYNSSNILSVCNKLGKHKIEIITPNIKNGILQVPQKGVPSIIIRNLKLFPMICNHNAVADNSDDIRDDKVLKIVAENPDHLKFPAVTRILDQTMSPESRAALQKWKDEKIEELGLEGFEKFNKAQLSSGINFHELLSQHFLTPSGATIDASSEKIWTSVSSVLKNISAPKAVESHVVHPVLKYRGIIDCIAIYQDKPTLIEWKKSDRHKPALSSTYDNPVQLAAYFGAISHDPLYKALNVRDALLVVAHTDGSPADVFELSTEDMRKHWADWLTRLEKYWTVADNKLKEAPKETIKAEA